MSGMDFEFTVGVNGTGELKALAGAARDAEHALDGLRDAEAEVGASSAAAAAGIAAQSAEMEAAAAAMRAMQNDTRRVFMDSAAGSIRAAGGMDSYRKSIEDARQVAEEAARGIDDLQNATSRSGISSIAAAHGLRGIDRAGRDAADGLRDLEKEAGKAGGGGGRRGFLASLFGGLAKGGISALSSLKGAVLTPMGALIAGVGGLAAGAVPAVLSLGGGMAAFGALAAPALYKVKTGLSDVAWAQQQYQLARGVEARNPTKGNLAAEQRTLAALKTTWAQMPAPIRGAVSGIHQFEKAWSAAGRKSGIQKAAFGDIRLLAKDAQAAIPAVTGLAKAFQPILRGGIRNLGKEFKSSGFHSWIKNLEKDMGPAAHALKGIGGAFGGFITQLTAREAKPGTQMLTNIGKFLKTITPGAVSGLVGLTKGVSGLFDTMDKIASSKFVSNIVRAGKAVGHFLHSSTVKGSMGWQVLMAEQKVLAKRAAVLRVRPVISGAGNIGAALGLRKSVPLLIRPQIAPGSLGAAVASAQKSLGSGVHSVQQALHIKPKIDGGDVKRQISDAAKTGGNIPVKGRVTLTGLAGGIKSQIANLHIPDSKVKLSIQVTGAGQARSAVSSVVGAARKAAAGAAAALGGLGAAGSHAGASLSAGLAAGINAGAGAVAAAARHVAGIAAAAMAIEAEIKSPSKKAERLGRQIDLGLAKGLLGGEGEIAKAASLITGKAMPFKDAKISQTIRKLRADVRKAFREHEISKTQRDSYIDFIDRGNKRLMGLAQQRARIEAKITAAVKLAASVRQSAIASADITGLAANVDAQKNKGYGGGTIAAGQKDQLAKIREFTRDIRKLKKEGLDKTSIKQLLAAGVSGGLPAAQQLLAGGPKGVKEVSKLQKQIIDASRKLGVTGANAAYESGSQIGKGLAAGLRSELKGIEQAMAQLARHLVNELRKELGLPPLKGGKGLGMGGGGGGHHKPKHPGGGGVQMLPGGGHLFGGGPGGMQMHPGAQMIHNHIHVHMDGREVATTVQVHSLRRARRNVATGLKLANRGI